MRPVAAGIVTLIAVESVSFGGLHLVEARAPGTVLDLFIDAHASSVADAVPGFVDDAYDPVLGWAFRPGRTTHEARDGSWTRTILADGSRAPSAPNAWMHSYGDSFVAGDEVDDVETWQAALGGVRNYGVSGYGPYQSLLRFEAHAADGLVAPVTLLGIFEDGIGRAQNRFRPFYMDQTSIPLGFKPAVVLVDEDLAERPLPWDGHGNVREAMQTASVDDVWAAQKVRMGAPHLLGVLQGYRRPSRWETLRTLWDDPRIIRHILDRFIATAAAHGSRPVVLWFPRGATARAARPGAYAAHVGYGDALHIDLDDVLRDPAAWTGDWTGHLSPHGTRLVADRLREALAEVR